MDPVNIDSESKEPTPPNTNDNSTNPEESSSIKESNSPNIHVGNATNSEDPSPLYPKILERLEYFFGDQTTPSSQTGIG